MRERPILFSGPMVRAILAGQKTQTRRVVKPQPEGVEGATFVEDRGLFHPCRDELCRGALDQIGPPVRCPYGAPGDRLWVRETWAEGAGNDSRALIAYRADGTARAALYEGDGEGDFSHVGEPVVPPAEVARWRPAIYMRRGACRLVLEVTSVRVERLQDISPTDIAAEGAVARSHDDRNLGRCPVSAFDERLYPDLRSLWAAGWDAINGKRDGASWSANPWVWVVGFKRAALAADEKEGR